MHVVAGFLDVVRRAEAHLEREPRVSIRALRREFDLDDDAVEALVEELVDVRQVAVRDGSVLVSLRAVSMPASVLPHAVDTESRDLTVLFCDLVGSTELSTQLDSEDYADAMRAYHEAATAVVTRFGGFVAQLLGDGMLVLFGYPEAQEDSAEQAVRAALEVVHAVDALQRGLSVRVGLHSGPCVVRTVGAGGRQDTLALGETTNIAARIQSAADPHTVLISAATERLVAGWFVNEEVAGAHEFKGVAEPMVLHRVIGPSSVRSPLEARSARGLAPLVGRDAECAFLLERWRLAAAGDAQVVHISGEPGIGKSRLMRELRERLATVPHRWLDGACSPYSSNTAFFPMIRLTEEALGFATADSDSGKLDRIEAGLNAVGFEDADRLALMSAFLSVPHAFSSGFDELSPEARRRRTIEVLVEWLVTLSDQDPIVAFVEDLHWCDASSLELIGQVVERASGRLLLVTTSRPEFSPAWLEAEHVRGLNLERMSDAQAMEIVRAMLAKSDVDDDVAQRIVERAEGIPLFVEEISQVVLEASDTSSAPTLGEIPATLQSPLLARLDRLGSAKEVVQVASVLGRDFSGELLRIVIGSERPGLIDDKDLDRALSELTIAGLLTTRSDAPATFSFKHSLLQDAAYQSLLKRTRRELHGRVFRVLGEHFPERVEAQPELAARHAEAAGMTDEAVEFYRRAAVQAEDRSAHEEALLHLQRALDVVLAEAPGIERDRRETAVMEDRVSVLFRARGWAAAESVAALERVRDLSLATGDRRSYGSVLVGLGVSHYLAGRLEQALELVDEAIAVAEEIGAVANVITCLTVRGTVAYFQGRFHDSLEWSVQAAELYDPVRHHHDVVALAGDDSGVTATGTAGWAWFQLGGLDSGIARTNEAADLAKKLGHSFTLAQARVWELALLVELEDEGLEGPIAELLRYCETQGFPAFQGAAQTMLGKAAGDPAIVLEGIMLAAATNTTLMAPAVLCYLADAQRRRGQYVDAVASADAGLEIAAATGQHWMDGPLHRLRGESFLADDAQPIAARRDAAEACFRTAIDIARAQEARPYELRAALRLARLLAVTGRAEEGRALVAPLYAWFTEGLDAPDLRDARAFLADPLAP